MVPLRDRKGEEEEEGERVTHRWSFLRDMAALLHLVAMQPSWAEIRIRLLACCQGPLCSTGPAGDAITAGSCGWTTGLCSTQTNNPNYILNLQYTLALETTVTHSPSLLPGVCPSTSCSFCVIFGLFSHQVLLCPLISFTLPYTE